MGCKVLLAYARYSKVKHLADTVKVVC